MEPEEKKVQRELHLDELERVSGGAGSGEVLNSGFFLSNTGTGLNIRADWSVVRDLMGMKVLEVRVSACSYSLSSIALENAVELSVNGAVYVSNSAAVDYRGRDMTSNLLASFSIPNLVGSVTLAAVWRFRGTYSGVALNEIRAEGTAFI